MADFRKWLLVLAVVVFAASGFAQTTTISCAATPAQTPLLRDGGLAEIVGDVLLNCTPSGAAPGSGATFPTATANWQVFMNGPVTNRFTADNVPGIIVTDDVGGTQVYPGTTVVGNPNSVIFSQVTIPSGTVATVRIVNIRIAVPAASGVPGLPTPVQEIVTTSPVGIVPITTPVQIVGYVQPALDFNVVGCDGTAGGTTTFQQCISAPKTEGELHFAVKFSELFPTAFKPQLPEAVTPGEVVNSESGLHFTGSKGGTTRELATQGTELKVVFTGIPAGVHILVTNHELDVSSSTAAATLVPADGQDDTGTQATCNGVAVTNNAKVANTLVDITDAGMTATWEVTASAPGLPNEDFIFGVQVRYTAQTSAGLPGLTTAPGGSVSGTLAPVSTNITASATAPTPRFNIPPIAAGAPFAIVPCVTNLLFPYVTNTLSYDTGIALVNTSLDNAGDGMPFDTETQHGTCTLYFFGTPDVPPQTTNDIAAGSLEKFTLGNPPAEFTPDVTKGFEGYVIARCNFQYAHGFAFIVDGNLPGFGSEAYLALIIPDRGTAGRPPDPFANCNVNVANGTFGGGCGEQLVH